VDVEEGLGGPGAGEGGAGRRARSDGQWLLRLVAVLLLLNALLLGYWVAHPHATGWLPHGGGGGNPVPAPAATAAAVLARAAGGGAAGGAAGAVRLQPRAAMALVGAENGGGGGAEAAVRVALRRLRWGGQGS
jgi:hypothetical protein